jgi:hypothetical protein
LVAPSGVGAAAEVTVTATAIPGEYAVEVRGFDAGERASTWLTGPHQEVAAGSLYLVDDRGTLAFTLFAPRYFQAGRWAITVHGLRSDREAIAGFDVPRRGPDIALAVTPSRLAPGDTLTVTGAGFGPEDSISYWLTGPDGRGYAGGYALTGLDGRLAFSFAVSTTLPDGLWVLSAYGSAGDHFGVAYFAVVGPEGGPATPGLRPEEATYAFYAWYIRYPGGALASGAYKGSPLLTETLKANIEAAATASPGVDPVVCAARLPASIRTSEPTIAADTARVAVFTDLPNSFVVVVRIIDGQWRLDDILCEGA